MNDQQMDQQLRQLFETDFRPVDPHLPGATALLQSIVENRVDAEINFADLADSKPAPNINSPEFDGALTPYVAELPQPNRARILVAAAILLAVLLGVSRWAFPASDELPVLSEGIEVNAGGEVAPLNFIEGPASPLVLIDHSGLASELILDCSAGLQIPGENPLFEGSAVLGVIHGSASAASPIAEGTTPAIAEVANALESTTCVFDEVPTVQASLATSERVLPNGATITMISRPIGGVGVVVGRLADNVAEVRLVDVPSESQDFQRFGDGLFRLDYDSPFDLMLEVVFNDGSSLQSDPNLLISPPEAHRCTNAACVAERLNALQAEALEAGAFTQAEYLESGVLSQSEYDAAEAAFVDCLSAEIELGPGPTILQARSDEANLAQGCFNGEIAFLERARLQQNGIAQILAEFFGRSQTEPAVVVAEVDQLLDGGLSAEELEELWSPFVFTDTERDLLIEQYLDGFAWMQQGIEIELYSFEQTPGIGVVSWVVVAQSIQDRELATAFVFDEFNGELVLTKLPEFDGVPTASYDRSTNQLVTNGVISEGRIAGFYDGAELDRVTGAAGAEARFELPSNSSELSVAVLVTPSPNGTVAEVVVLK